MDSNNLYLILYIKFHSKMCNDISLFVIVDMWFYNAIKKYWLI